MEPLQSCSNHETLGHISFFPKVYFLLVLKQKTVSAMPGWGNAREKTANIGKHRYIKNKTFERHSKNAERSRKTKVST